MVEPRSRYEPRFHGLQTGHQVFAESARFAKLARNGLNGCFAPPFLKHAVHLAKDSIEHLPELLEITAHEQKLALDLFDGEALRHHLFDAENLAHDTHRVDALGAFVLALLSDSHAARQQAELNVFSERRLTELDVVPREQVEDLDGRQPASMLFFDPFERGVVDHVCMP
jgi:hypothetical protein